MKISYDDVNEYCNELHSLSKQMKETIENVTDAGRKIQSSGAWEGEASDYFLERLKALTSSFEDIFIEIENSILFMARSSEGYQKIDNTILAEICNNLNVTSPEMSASKIFR